MEKANRLDRIIVYVDIKEESFTLAELLHILDKHKCTCEAEQVKKSLARLALAFILSRTKKLHLLCARIQKDGP